MRNRFNPAVLAEMAFLKVKVKSVQLEYVECSQDDSPSGTRVSGPKTYHVKLSFLNHTEILDQDELDDLIDVMKRQGVDAVETNRLKTQAEGIA